VFASNKKKWIKMSSNFTNASDTCFFGDKQSYNSPSAIELIITMIEIKG